MADDIPPPPGKVFYPEDYIPRRNDDLSPHFTDPRHVNAQADSTLPVVRYDARRRFIAILVTLAMVGWMALGFSRMMTQGSLGAWKLYLLLFRGLLAAAVTVAVWRWANRPVRPRPARAG